MSEVDESRASSELVRMLLSLVDSDEDEGALRRGKEQFFFSVGSAAMRSPLKLTPPVAALVPDCVLLLLAALLLLPLLLLLLKLTS